MHWFDFSSSSGARVAGIGVYGGHSKRWWHRAFVRPIYRAGNRIHRLGWSLRHRFDPRHRYNVVHTGLEPGYYDVDELMMHSCFALLCRYVEKEMGGFERLRAFTADLQRRPDPNAPPEIMQAQARTQTEAGLLYVWWKEAYPAMKQRRCELVHELFGKGRRLKTREVPGTGLSRMDVSKDTVDEAALQGELYGLEERIDREEQEYLHRLIDVRRSLWT